MLLSMSPSQTLTSLQVPTRKSAHKSLLLEPCLSLEGAKQQDTSLGGKREVFEPGGFSSWPSLERTFSLPEAGFKQELCKNRDQRGQEWAQPTKANHPTSSWVEDDASAGTVPGCARHKAGLSHCSVPHSSRAKEAQKSLVMLRQESEAS